MARKKLNLIHFSFLQDLENYIRNHSEERLEKIKEIGQELINKEFMAHSIENEIGSVLDRWKNLQHQVSF
jgi:hypothetical protein